MTKLPDIGTLDRKCFIKAKTKSVDSYGTPVISLVTYTTAWAAIFSLSNNEKVVMERETLLSSFKAHLHYYPGINTDMVLVTSDTEESFDIKSVVTLGRKQFIEMIIEKIIV